MIKPNYAFSNLKEALWSSFDGLSIKILGHKVMHNPSFNSKKFKGKRGEQERKEEGDADRTNAKTRRANFSSTTAHSSSSFLVSRKGSKRKKTSS